MINFDVKIDIDKGKLKSKEEQAAKLSQFQLDEAVLKDSNDYIPADTWNLRDSSFLHSKIGKGEVAWQTKYARRLYYNPQYNFSKDKNPKAQGLWFEAAKAQNKKHWIDIAKKVYKEVFDGR